MSSEVEMQEESRRENFRHVISELKRGLQRLDGSCRTSASGNIRAIHVLLNNILEEETRYN